MRQHVVVTLLLLTMAAGGLTPVFGQGQGKLKCVGNVGRAGIFVDGKYIGPASRFTVAETYTVDTGQHEVMLRDPRYEDFKTSVTVEENKTTKVKFNMTKKQMVPPPYGRVRFGGGTPDSFMSVVAGDTSPIYLNGAFWGYIDEFNNAGSGMVLPPGTYEIRVDSPIYGQINEKVTIEANKVTVIPLKW